MARFTTLLALLAAAVQSSPTPEVLPQNFARGKLPEVICKKVNVVVTVLKLFKATPFCSSYLGIPAVTSTSTITVTTGVSYVFRPGKSPVPAKLKRGLDIEERNKKPQKPDYLKGYSKDVIASGCKCLDIPIKTIVISTTSTVTPTVAYTTTITSTPLSISTVTTTRTVPSATTTLYPCATPLPSLIPTIPYGDAQSPVDLGTSNSIFGLSDPQGASAEACCNTCYFGVTNCIQAYWYSYQGCVVSQASAVGSGVGVSSSCPSGLFAGLTYAPDSSPAFRSTGDFAGPCGERYNNL